MKPMVLSLRYSNSQFWPSRYLVVCANLLGEILKLRRSNREDGLALADERLHARVAEEHTWQVAERRDVDSKRRERQTVRLCLRACIRERKRKREKNGTIYRSSISLRAK